MSNEDSLMIGGLPGLSSMASVVMGWGEAYTSENLRSLLEKLSLAEP